MGRDYFGSISGKFCFGIQESDDIENLINIEYEKEYTWNGCNCFIEVSDLDKNLYCKECFNDYEEHFEAVREDYELDGNVTDSTNNPKLYSETSYINYTISKEEHYEQLIESLIDLKKLLPKDVIEEFDKITNHDEIIDGYSDIFTNVYLSINKYKDSNFEQLLLYFSRYKIGMQIKYFLDRNDSCFVSCET